MFFYNLGSARLRSGRFSGAELESAAIAIKDLIGDGKSSLIPEFVHEPYYKVLIIIHKVVLRFKKPIIQFQK